MNELTLQQTIRNVGVSSDNLDYDDYIDYEDIYIYDGNMEDFEPFNPTVN